MPVQDRGNAVERLDGNSIKAWKIQFPLARVYSKLTPGDYDCRIQFTFFQGKTNWWRGDNASWNEAGCWHGTVVSAPFPLTVKKDTAKTNTLLLPKKLSLAAESVMVREDDPKKTAVPIVRFRKDDAEKVTLPVRNGHFMMAKYYRDGKFYQMSSPPKADDVNAIDQWFAYKDGDRKVFYTIEIFESAERPHHLWHPDPASEGYKVLWKRTFYLSLTEKEIKKLLMVNQQATP